MDGEQFDNMKASSEDCLSVFDEYNTCLLNDKVEPVMNACLHKYGIQGDLLRWLTKFFTGRTHQTRVGLSLSAVAELLSGVVQGSGIGPVLFLSLIHISEPTRPY